MKQAIINWLNQNGGRHLAALLIAGTLVFMGRMWLQEHDQRLQADTRVKTAQTAIDTLQKQQSAIAQAANVQTVTLQKKAAAVRTAPQAVQALQADPEVKAALPTLEAVPDSPDVKVNALELFKGVNKCEQDAVNFGACSKELDIQKQITTEKDVQIVALKKKRGFWRRIGKAAEVVGCAAGGAVAGSYLNGAKGAAIGSAAGAGLCQIF